MANRSLLVLWISSILITSPVAAKKPAGLSEKKAAEQRLAALAKASNAKPPEFKEGYNLFELWVMVHSPGVEYSRISSHTSGDFSWVVLRHKTDPMQNIFLELKGKNRIAVPSTQAEANRILHARAKKTGGAGEILFKERTDSSGFKIAGRNGTALISTLKEINDISVEELERRMFPQSYSKTGFLGENEHLLDVLASDNKLVVDTWGLTHQELGKPLLDFCRMFEDDLQNREVTYHGKRYRLEGEIAKGWQDSPFGDEPDSVNGLNLKVTNLENHKTLEYSSLLPDLIIRYGFYEGKSSKYRIEPSAIVEVFDFIHLKNVARN